ncbi:sporulation protein [Halospeciosus flavus]|uniref:Sporulation protein n=1 Tax=Halospeciosus flavus TaxID=3032283 RepID=A0ABD5Z0A4_9EURY|nr:sporulation protein [Halospeciosus flavus]
MKKILASIGIGNATVDTVLPSTTVTPGETVEAEVQITGGNAEQDVGAIRFELETRAKTDDGYTEVDIDRFTLTESLTIEPDAEETRTVDIDVPYETPVTIGNTRVWIETELDIERAVDPEDTDYLDVQPTPRLQAVFDAMDELGFSFRTADCEYDPHGRYTTGRPFVQEFEFRPQSGQFVDDLDEVELVARPDADALTLFVEVDRRGGLLSELAETDERKTSTTIESTDVATVRDQLQSLVEEHV